VLSPFLSNVGLDEVEKEWERRGHRFGRYADDANLYGKSERAGARGMERVSHCLTRRLKVRGNQAKSAGGKPQERKFLGLTFTGGKPPNRRKIAPAALVRFKAQVRQLTRRTWGISLPARIQRLASDLKGWREY
jgi:RNA-directed DNA polymerase